MGAKELRDELRDKFSLFIQDDSKLFILSGIFDSLNTSTADSLIPEEHYKIVEGRRNDRLAERTKGDNWEDFKEKLKNKYGY